MNTRYIFWKLAQVMTLVLLALVVMGLPGQPEHTALAQGGDKAPYYHIRLPFAREDSYSVTKGPGPDLPPVGHGLDRHAVDFGMSSGTPAYAMHGGRVDSAKDYGDEYSGLTVVVDHGDGYCSLYFHLKSIEVEEGQIVSQGQHIGNVGETGKADGPHLHVSVTRKKNDSCTGDWDAEVPMHFDEMLEKGKDQELKKDDKPVSLNVASLADTRELPESLRNLIDNSDFNRGTRYWQFNDNDYIDYVVKTNSITGNKTLHFKGLEDRGKNPSVLQDVYYKVPPDTPFEITLKLGNTTPVEKPVQIVLHDLNNLNSTEGNISCDLTLPPGQPSDNGELPTYTIRGVANHSSEEWEYFRFEIYAKDFDGIPDILLDDVAVRYIDLPPGDIEALKEETLCPNQKESEIDELVRAVKNQSGEPYLRGYLDPNLSAAPTADIEWNKIGHLVGGPQSTDGITWWQVKWIDGSITNLQDDDAIRQGYWSDAFYLQKITDSPFLDVDYGHPFFNEIVIVKEAGLFSGFSDGNFRADNNIIRKNVALVTARWLLGRTPEMSDIPDGFQNFPDINDENDPAHIAVEWLAEEGIVRGNSAGAFEPEKETSRGEFVSIVMQGLTRQQDYTSGTRNCPFDFIDVPDDNPHRENIIEACELGIVRGYSNGNDSGPAEFRIDQPISRGQAAKILGRAYLVMVDTPFEVFDEVNQQMSIAEEIFDFAISDDLLELRRTARYDHDSERAMINISPSNTSLDINQTTTTQVQVDAVTNFYASQFRLNFDPAIVQVVDVDPNNDGVQIAVGDLFIGTDHFVAVNSVDNAAGEIEFSASLRSPAGSFNGSGPLAEITWQAVALGHSDVSFTESKLSDPEGFALDHQRENGVIAVNDDDEKASGKVLLQGRTDHNGSDVFLLEETCEQVYYNNSLAAANVPGIPHAVTDAQGNFEISPIPGYTYRCLQVFHHAYLVGQSDSFGQLGTITLLGGDVTQDDLIDIFDLAYIGARYNGTDATADINGDGLVDIYDLALAASNYGQEGPMRWPLISQASLER